MNTDPFMIEMDFQFLKIVNFSIISDFFFQVSIHKI